MLSAHNDLVSYVEFNQLLTAVETSDEKKSEYSQYFTPGEVARQMASMLDFSEDIIKILDPGAGNGILFAACIDRILSQKIRPNKISVLAYEFNRELLSSLENVMDTCKRACLDKGIEFVGEIIIGDFLEETAKKLGLYKQIEEKFTHVIMNPPYKKVNVNSDSYKILKAVGKASTNLYTEFISVAETYLSRNGQMVTITPRSFCNGVYFKDFRKQILAKLNISIIHLFLSRNKAFLLDKVLQENIIIKWTRKLESSSVLISTSDGPADKLPLIREVQLSNIISPGDPEKIIKIPSDSLNDIFTDYIDKLPNSLEDLGLTASTGKVVDFRASEFITRLPRPNSVPLIQPECIVPFAKVKWAPKEMKKEPFISATDASMSLLVPDETYVLVKRFTTNEENKRLVASLYTKHGTYMSKVGFENRINYIHRNGRGIQDQLARGLSIYLNSSMVDSYFRQMSGHTQVNASDLLRLRYPSTDLLIEIGKLSFELDLNQTTADEMIKSMVFKMEKENNEDMAKRKIEESLSILKQIGMPREQQNERSALTLLALLDLKPEDSWSMASNPLIGITPMMNFFDEFYHKKYAPNTRETVRRFTVHQFCQAHVAVENPDDPSRPTNSPNTVYQVHEMALKLFQTYGSDEWESSLRKYLNEVPPLSDDYRGLNNTLKVDVNLPEEVELELSPGGQNVLVKEILENFVPRFVNSPKFVYIGDTNNKFLYYDANILRSIGITIDPHGKMPDVIVLDQSRNWLLLIEAVTSHGPINKKRKNELMKIFSNSHAGLVYVTAFPDRSIMVRYLREISWESEVWLADTPDHMIHFNGDRFRGPYE